MYNSILFDLLVIAAKIGVKTAAVKAQQNRLITIGQFLGPVCCIFQLVFACCTFSAFLMQKSLKHAKSVTNLLQNFSKNIFLNLH